MGVKRRLMADGRDAVTQTKQTRRRNDIHDENARAVRTTHPRPMMKLAPLPQS